MEQVLVFGAISDQVITVAQTIGLKQVHEVTDLASAVKRAVQVVTRPGVVLFSPSGSSFDQFTNYEHRGDEFRKIVAELTGQVIQYSPPTDASL